MLPFLFITSRLLSVSPALVIYKQQSILLLTMEALVAVGLASNVVQFIDFALKIVRESCEIQHSGAAVDATVLKDLTQRLVDLSTGLSQSTIDNSCANALTADERVRSTYTA